MEVGMTFQEIVVNFTKSVQHVSEAQELLEALAKTTSFSQVHKTRRVLSGALQLASIDMSFAHRFPDEFAVLLIDDSLVNPPPHPVINELEIPLQITDALACFLVGHKFFTIVLKERHCKGRMENDDYESWEVLFEGINAFEDYIDREWIEKEVQIEFGEFKSSIVNGSGQFSGTFKLGKVGDRRWKNSHFMCTAVDGKVTELSLAV
ncbi:UNVERIFIED_CONTAM: hypothetical protein HDU68_006696 [Siphonaria sp. JEL0065]|nr:hypothetical protein HDU68_006696 [Siphonaria sp. JEL0065]